MDKDSQRLLCLLGYAGLIYAVICVGFQIGDALSAHRVPYSELVSGVDAVQTERVEITEDEAKVFAKSGSASRAFLPPGSEARLYERLDSAGIPYGVRQPKTIIDRLFEIGILVFLLGRIDRWAASRGKDLFAWNKKIPVLSADQKKRVAFHEAGHAAALSAEGYGDRVRKISIRPGVEEFGSVTFVEIRGTDLKTRSDILRRIVFVLGGKISEEVFLGEGSTGSQNDLVKAGELADILFDTGLGLGPFDNTVCDRKHMSDAGLLRLEEGKRDLIRAQAERARRILEKNRTVVEEMVDALLRDETLTGDALQAFLKRVERE